MNNENLSNENKTEALNKHVVMRPKADCPDCKGSGGVQTGYMEYSTCPCVEAFGEPLGNEGRVKGVSVGNYREMCKHKGGDCSCLGGFCLFDD